MARQIDAFTSTPGDRRSATTAPTSITTGRVELDESGMIRLFTPAESPSHQLDEAVKWALGQAS